MDELMYDTLKTAITTDLLSSRDTNISIIRVKAIEDRNYDIPEWMYKYIRDDDINSLIVNHFNHDIDNWKFIEFMKNVIDKGIVKNYKYLTMTIIQYGIYDIVYLFNKDYLSKYLNMFKKELSVDDTISIIKSYTTRGMDVPLCYIYLYLSVSVSSVWYVRSRNVINQKLDELLNKLDSPDELDCIYPVLYQSCVFTMRHSQNDYRQYLLKGGTWCIDYNDAEVLYEYMASYCMYNKPRTKPMDPNIKEVLFKDEKRLHLFEYFDEEDLKMMIMESIIKHIDNIEFIYWDITPKQLEMLGAYLDVYKDTVPKNLDKLINLLFESNGVNYTGIYEIIMRYVEYGDDIKKIIPYIGFVATQENITELIAVMKESDIITIGELNPIIRDKSDMTFIDMVMRNIGSLSMGSLEKVRRAFSYSIDIYRELYGIEKYSLFGMNKDFHSIGAVYPGILVEDTNMSTIDIHEIYKKNPEIISYIKPSYLKDSLVHNHIMTHGYTKLQNMNRIGLEHLLNLQQIFQMLSKGVGYGHLLDFKNIGYINICIMYILHNTEK